MALSIDTSTSSLISTGATSTSWSHTIGTSSPNVCLIVAASLGYDGSGTAPSAISATYNSVSMTKAGEVSTSSGYCLVALFYLIKPTTGSNTVALSWTGSSIGRCYAVSVYDAHRVNPIRDSSYTTAGPDNSSPISISVPSNNGDIVFDVAAMEASTGTDSGLSEDASQTEIIDGDVQNARRMGYGGSRKSATTTSTTMQYTFTGSLYAIMAGFSVKPAAGAGGVVVSPTMVF